MQTDGFGDGFGGADDGFGGPDGGFGGAQDTPPPDGGPLDFNGSGSSLDEAILLGMIASQRSSDRSATDRPGRRGRRPPPSGGCLLPLLLLLAAIAAL